MLYVIFFVSLAYSSTAKEWDGCVVAINQNLNNPQPLMLLTNTTSTSAIASFPHPEDHNGNIFFQKGEKIELACPGGTLIATGEHTGESILTATCVSGKQFIINEKKALISNLKCTKIPQHKARHTGRNCAGKFSKLEIGVQVESRFIRHISVCYDNITQNTAFTVYNLTSRISGHQKGFARPGFKSGKFYNVGSSTVNKLYTRNIQRKTINKILGFPAASTTIIQKSNSYYLAKGHLTAMVDFVFGAQQRFTFYYINAAPQWQTLNAGNWKTLETNCRAFASNKSLDLVVYTGTYGVATLKNIHGDEKELYLYVDEQRRGIPVPEFFWKVLYEPKSKAGIAFVGVNNPHVADVERFVYCKDVCGKVDWLTWKPYDVNSGYSYCCDVNELRKTVTNMPRFKVRQLLV